MSSVYAELAAAVRAERPVALATVVASNDLSPAAGSPAAGSPAAGSAEVGSPAGSAEVGAKLVVTTEGGATVLAGSLGDRDLDRVVARDAAGQLADGSTRLRRYGPHGEARRDDVTVFIETFVPPPVMVIFGAVDFTAALARVAKVLHYKVIVCDARAVFATRARFPSADEVVVDWPHRLLEKIGPTLTPRDAVCVLTHDAKFDVPAVVGTLATQAGYLGVMGSRRTHQERLARLRAAGVDEAGLARMHSPVGLDIGALTPEETAVSICAEIIAVRAGHADIRPLSASDGPIHRRRASRRDAAVPRTDPASPN